MATANLTPQPRIQPVPEPFEKAGLAADVLRLDEVHPVVSGNKWYKLKYWLQQCVDEGKQGLLTWGGAWSNHLLATAAACAAAGLQSIGIVRGERPALLSPTLEDAQRYGMQLHFVSRSFYKEGTVPHHLLIDDFLQVPAGGYGALGAAGAAEILRGIPPQYSHIICAVGTGTMMAGLMQAASQDCTVIGISSQKANLSLHNEVSRLAHKSKPVFIEHRFHFGGYARWNTTLLRFMNDWYGQTGIPTDFVYTAKTFYAAQQLANEGLFAEGSKLLLIHSGGLQGNRGLPPHSLIFSS